MTEGKSGEMPGDELKGLLDAGAMVWKEKLTKTQEALEVAVAENKALKLAMPCLCANGDGSTCNYCKRIKEIQGD